jgi:hypothetical protein
MQILLRIDISDFSDFEDAVKKRFGDQGEFFLRLKATSALPPYTDIPYGDLFKREEDDDEANATLCIDQDSYYPDYEPLDDQLIYTVVPDEDFNLTETEFLAWLAEEWGNDRLKLRAA